MNFKKQDNKFQYLLDYADFYNSETEYSKAIQDCEKLLEDNSTSIEDKLELRLAIVWIKLHKGDLYGPAAQKEIDELLTQVKGKGILEKVFGIVLAKTKIMHGRYQETKEILEQLEQDLKYTEHHILYALVAKSLANVYIVLGDVNKGEEYSHDCISVFRKFDNKILLANCLSNYGIIKKKFCQYADAERLFRKSLKIYLNTKSTEGEALCYGNLGIINLKLGDWNAAEYYYKKAHKLLNQIFQSNPKKFVSLVKIANLLLMKRQFVETKDLLEVLLVKYSRFEVLRDEALIHEYLGALYTEMNHLELAKNKLIHAENIVLETAPEGDEMTTIKRRKADLFLIQGRKEEARSELFFCIRLCKRINNKYEMGVALRLLGKYHLSSDQNRKAVSAFESSINILKGIHECYELMRSCLSYSEYLISINSEMAEVYLLEAKQLCKKIALDYFMCRILLLLGRYAIMRNDYKQARFNLKEAETICSRLNEIDIKKVLPKIKEFYSALEGAVLKAGMNSARKLRVLGKIYEEARFPLDEIRPELAMQVANQVGADSLFLVRRKNNGYGIDLLFNTSVREAKNIIKVIDLKSKRKIFEKNRDPRIFDLGNGTTAVCVPGYSGAGYVLCSIVRNEDGFSPGQYEFLFASVEALERLATEKFENKYLNEQQNDLAGKPYRGTHPGGAFRKIVTIDPQMINIIRMAGRASQVNVPVLLEGETGVGKELFARAIHDTSPRSKREFVAINAGGINVNLLESQLFGHVKGAFTDACMDRIGLIEEAAGGSIFFDEIGEMSEELQVKLLRLLENKEFRRLGDNRLRQADVRIISATNLDLREQVDKKLFRKDLFYRLSTLRFSIPPLRFRQRDIEILVRKLLKDALVEIGRAGCHIEVDMKALEAFELYNWPGNVRELQNEILRVVSLMGNNELIRFNMLSDTIRSYFADNKYEGLFEQNVERYERRLILRALEKNDWNRIRTAEQMGIPRTTLLGKMKRLNIVR